MKTSYRKYQPKKIHYDNYKNFSNDLFKESLQKKFPQNLVNSKVLDQYAPRKKKFIWATSKTWTRTLDPNLKKLGP